ncbi:MAG: hypothetical protein V3T70_09440 [Phycisphaerae bacterium]
MKRHGLAAFLSLSLVVGAMAGAAMGGEVTRYDFDANVVGSPARNISFIQNPAPGAFSSPADGFEVFQRNVSPSIPFAVLDDSLVIFTGDRIGVIKDQYLNAWFGIADTDNSQNPGGAFIAQWRFNVSGFSSLCVSIDMGAMGDFESSDVFDWTARIDGGAVVPVFTSFVDNAGSHTYTMEGGAQFTLNDPLFMNGVLVDNDLSTFDSGGIGSGNLLQLTLTGQTNGGNEGYVFDNVVINSGDIAIDIKPESCPNPLNRKSRGVVPISLLGNTGIDVNQIDLATVRLVRADGVGGAVSPNEGPPGPKSKIADNGTPSGCGGCLCHDEGDDGHDDLSMKYRTEDVVSALQLDGLMNGDEVELLVIGNLLDGTPFATDSDCVLLVPKGVTTLSVNSNADDAFIWLSPGDMTADSDGFSGFERSYPVGSVVTLNAPAVAETGTDNDKRPFVAWYVDGVKQTVGQFTINVTVGASTIVDAIYGNAPGRRLKGAAGTLDPK